MRELFTQVCEDVTKTATKIPQSKYLSNGKTPIFDQGAGCVAGYSNLEDGIADDCPYIIFGDHTRILKYVEVPCFIGADGVKLLKVFNKKYLPKYVFYNLLANPVESHGYSRHFKYLKENTIQSVSLLEQKRIIEELDNILACIENSEKQLLILDETIKSRFNDMFAESLINKTRKCKFSDICESLIGLTYKPENVSDVGTIVLRSGNIQDGELYLKDDVVRVNNIAIKEEKMVRPLDILMCSRNGSSRLVGKTCIIKNIEEPMTFGAFMAIIRTPFPYIVNSFMNTNYFRDQLTGTQTASVNQITTKMLFDYDIFLPTGEEEKEFRDFVELIDKSKFVVQQQIRDLKELLDKKMDEYFGG